MGRRLVPLILLLAWLVGAPVARAHLGPPYPVLLEQQVGPYLVSALADPDVGVGTFLAEVKLADGSPVPDDTVVGFWITPQSGHSAEVGYRAERKLTKNGERFEAKVRFDTEETWHVRLIVDGSAGRGETSFDVKVTPPTPGWLWTAICLLPFVTLGILWLVVTLRQSQSTPTASSAANGEGLG